MADDVLRIGSRHATVGRPMGRSSALRDGQTVADQREATERMDNAFGALTKV